MNFDPRKERHFAIRHAIPPALIAICLAVAAACCGCASEWDVAENPPPQAIMWTAPASSEAEALMRSAWEEWRVIVAMVGAGEYDAAWERGRLLLARWGEILARPGARATSAVPSSAAGVPAGTGATWGQPDTAPTQPTPDVQGVIERGEAAIEEMNDEAPEE